MILNTVLNGKQKNKLTNVDSSKTSFILLQIESQRN